MWIICTIVHTIDKWRISGTKTKQQRTSVSTGLILPMQFLCSRTISQSQHLDERFDEERFITIGLDALGRVLVVVYAWRDREIRLISARSATRQERRQYEEG
jgi:uncharacterized DUF497 family protein